MEGVSPAEKKRHFVFKKRTGTITDYRDLRDISVSTKYEPYLDPDSNLPTIQNFLNNWGN